MNQKNEVIPLVDLKAQYRTLKEEVNAAVASVFDSTRFINGTEIACFEKSFSEYCGVEFCAATASGTAALTLALLAAGVSSGDEVITVAHTFVATIEAIIRCGARPILIDIDPTTGLLDTALLAGAITPRTKAIVPVHLYGQMVPLEPLAKIARDHGILIIEDAAHAHGARQTSYGPGTLSDAAIFSFYPGKNLGAYGDAGAVVTQNVKIAEQVRILRDHGRISKNESALVGYCERMDTLQAAILSTKLPHLEQWNQLRQERAEWYRIFLNDLPISLPKKLVDNVHVYHLFVIRSKERDELRKFLNERGIETGIHYPVPVHLQPAYRHLGYSEGDLSETEVVAKEVLSLPLYPELTLSQTRYVAEQIASFYDARL